MLKPDFPKKGMGKEKWKERKGRNGKKEKEKMKIKKRTKERKWRMMATLIEKEKTDI